MRGGGVFYSNVSFLAVELWCTILFDCSSVIIIQRQRNKTKAMTTIEKISMMIISLRNFNNKRVYIKEKNIDTYCTYLWVPPLTTRKRRKYVIYVPYKKEILTFKLFRCSPYCTLLRTDLFPIILTIYRVRTIN
jgi:hypothetical protein